MPDEPKPAGSGATHAPAMSNKDNTVPSMDKPKKEKRKKRRHAVEVEDSSSESSSSESSESEDDERTKKLAALQEQVTIFSAWHAFQTIFER